ncbi:magnesium/cobalt transporter CorA [Actinoplanes sichuanensis]|uniref:Magnesium transport protein CorA n=1 Tax=Actinoplanes sichuanensis TaxID=512349 RepID=A0ABW4A1R1_9ACTN
MIGRLSRGLSRMATGAPPAPAPQRVGDVRRFVVGCGVYVNGRRVDGGEDLARLYRRARRTPGAFVWLGLHDPDERQLAYVADIFGLHPLAVEDVLQQEQRPKVERYEDSSFIVLRATQYVEHAELTDTSEVVNTGFVRVFVGDSFVVTVRQGDVGELGSVRAQLEAAPTMLAHGPWAVVHAVFDRVVDTYVDIVAALQTDVDAVEAGVFARGPSVSMEQIYQLKRELMEFKSAVVPLHRPLAALTNGQMDTVVPQEIRRYFRDVADHHARAVDAVVNYDDLLNTILQARLGQVTVDQNNDMRKIASWAAIAALQTAIAGIYGMNFDYMPELEWRYGYPGVLLVMLFSAVLLYRRLRRAGWL